MLIAFIIFSERCKSNPNLCLCLDCNRNARNMGRRFVNALEYIDKSSVWGADITNVSVEKVSYVNKAVKLL